MENNNNNINNNINNNEEIKIVQKWVDKSRQFILGFDKNRNIYCKRKEGNYNLILFDKYFIKNKKLYYRFFDSERNIFIDFSH
jgi:hypothetical protein